MTTYYVSGVDGNDANAGTSEGSGNSWATIDKAMNTVAAGDKVWVKGDGNYAELVTMDTLGTSGSWIVFEGYTSTTGDGGKITIDATGNTNGVVSALGTSYYAFKNIIVDGATGDGWAGGSSTDNCIFDNCEANNNGGDGWDVWDRNNTWINCDSTGNTGSGYRSSGIAHLYIASRSAANALFGFYRTTAGGTFYLCTSSSDANGGMQIVASNFACGAVFNCTVDGDADDSDYGLKFTASAYPSSAINNIFYDCATGIDLHASMDAVAKSLIDFNLLNGNAADYANQGDAGTNDVSGTPDFTAEGSDYTLTSTSSAINAGFDAAGASPGMDIGAHQSTDAGGAGGMIVHPGMTGNIHG